MPVKTYDVRCHDLAVVFLSDVMDPTSPDVATHADNLAKEIQQCIEDYIRFQVKEGSPTGRTKNAHSPSIQSIPVRTEEGTRIKKAFRRRD